MATCATGLLSSSRALTSSPPQPTADGAGKCDDASSGRARVTSRTMRLIQHYYHRYRRRQLRETLQHCLDTPTQCRFCGGGDGGGRGVSSSSGSCGSGSGSGSSSSCSSARPSTWLLEHRYTQPIHRLPRDLLHRIFVEVIEGDTRGLRCIAVLARVCQRWHALCRHPVMWSYVAKRACVSYPFIVRLQLNAPLNATGKEMVQSIPLLACASGVVRHNELSEHAMTTASADVLTTARDSGGAGAMVRSTACCVHHTTPLSPPLMVPSPHRLCQVLESVKKYQACQHYYKHVQRQRSVVLNVFLSLTLLSFSMCIASAMAAAEGAQCGIVCTRTASFAFLWLSYVFIAAIIVSNVVMQAHFEPQPLLLRLRNNKTLIMASAATIALGLCDVVIPTVLIEVNLTRQQRFSWFWCGITVILSFCGWQCYTFVHIMSDAKEQLHQQLTSVNVKEGFQFVVLNVPNTFPLLFAAAAFCTLQYVQHGSRIYVLLGGVPVVVSLLVLSLVFLLDFFVLRRVKDLSVGLCLLVASLCPLYLLIWDFRGWCLLPLAVASFGFFISHAHFVVSRALDDLLNAERARAMRMRL